MTAFPTKFFVFCLLAVAAVSCSKVEDSSAKGQESWGFPKAGPTPAFSAGETVQFVIKSLGVKAGEATLVFEGLQKLGNKEVYLISFRATSANFLDEEKIYADKDTFYPIL